MLPRSAQTGPASDGVDPMRQGCRLHDGALNMARLLPLLLAPAVVLVWLITRQQADRPRSDRTYRPRADPRAGGGALPSAWAGGADHGTDWVVARSELGGVRDAYSSAELDASKPLCRCGGCQAYRHRSSLDALRASQLVQARSSMDRTLRSPLRRRNITIHTPSSGMVI
jgi:hypothetical protein